MPDDAPGRDPRPLFSVEAEQAVLGGLMLSSAAFDHIVGVTSLDDFYTEDHRAIFRCVDRLLREGKQADVLTVSETLKSAGDLERVGGMAYLHSLATGTFSAKNIKRYAEIVHDRAKIRRVGIAASAIASLVHEANGLSGSDILDRAQALLGQIASTTSQGRGELKQIAGFVTAAMERLEEANRAHQAQGMAGISTGFSDLDDRIGGMKPGNLIVVAGRPGMGKSAIALNIVRDVAVRQRLGAGYFSMEMEAAELATRQLADLGNLHGLRLSHGRITPQEWQDIGRVVPTLYEAPIFLCEDGYLSITEITAGARRMARESKSKLGVLVIDYIGLMRTERQTSNRAQDLAEISRGLKALAKELKVPILLLCQLNRECEKRGDKRPILSDLRDSGEIEADADLVLMIYRDEVYHEDRDDNRGKAEVLIRKQRNGPTGRVLLHYDGARTRFSDWDAAR